MQMSCRNLEKHLRQLATLGSWKEAGNTYLFLHNVESEGSAVEETDTRSVINTQHENQQLLAGTSSWKALSALSYQLKSFSGSFPN